MVNALGVVGWGVGGIEAEACLLGQPLSMLIPDVVGFKLTGRLRAGATATDLVLQVTQMLRAHGVVGKFVEFHGDGLAALSLADRATVANMAPEYGATIGFFPVDEESLDYLRLTGRDEAQIELVRDYLRAQGLLALRGAAEPEYSSRLELDLGDVEPNLAGPSRPQDRVPLRESKARWQDARQRLAPERSKPKGVAVEHEGRRFELADGSVVIAAITSCTNTSNPTVLVAAGLLARGAVERGLRVPPWVKTSLAPGSRVVEDYLGRAGLLEPLETLGFYVVGFGCTTCIGNSGPLPEPISRAIRESDLLAVSVLSGNRNFEGRIHPEVRANYLASPPLVVAYALAGTMNIDLGSEPLGHDREGRPVHLREIWPSPERVQAVVRDSVKTELFRARYARVLEGSAEWRAIEAPVGRRYAWDPRSTYVRRPPYFDGMSRVPRPPAEIRGARVLCWLGDSVTTDHISPAGSIAKQSPAARYLIEQGVAPEEFNSYGARRGNHEVMVRGTFANIRLRNRLAPGTEGGVTVVMPGGREPIPIFDAAERYRADGVPLVVIAGREYGTGSSRDWAAKGTALLGVRAVLAQSYERIHRSNLVGMGVLPLEFPEGESAESLGLTGRERFDVLGIDGLRPRATLTVRARPDAGEARELRLLARIDTPFELEYYRHGGILPYVLRQLA
jgi:aconitate hydratase